MTAKVERDLDRILTLLRNKIREKGFTQLEVQNALNWGRSYISQLLTKQKSLRVEQIHMILDVIGVEPAEFYGELYHFSSSDSGVRNLDDYIDHGSLSAASGEPRETGHAAVDNLQHGFEEMRSVMRRLVQLLVDKKVLDTEDLEPGRGELDPPPGKGG